MNINLRHLYNIGYFEGIILQRIQKRIEHFSYDLDGFGGSVNFSVPMSKFLTFSYGVGYDQQNVKATQYTPYSINHFINPNWNYHKLDPTKSVPSIVGQKSPTFHTTKLVAGLDYSDTDRYYFPTKGTNTSFNLTGSVPVINPNLSYYMANFKALGIFHEKTSDWVLPAYQRQHWSWLWQNKQFPFMYNFFGGGISTVPGFSDNTLVVIGGATL